MAREPRDLEPPGGEGGGVSAGGRARRGRVLLVDDEPMVGRIVTRVLSGYEVLLASGGREALECIGESAAFDVILCDLMMPGMNGIELHAEIAARDPELAKRFVFLTGGAFSPEARAFLDRSENTTLQKPFSIDALRAAVDARMR